MANKVKIISLNVNGIGDYHKRKDVFDYLRGKNANIILLQETHLKTQDENVIRSMWGYDCLLNGISTNSNGVGIFFSTNFHYKIHRINRDLEGRYILLDIEMNNHRHTLVNIYGPSDRDNPDFFDDVLEKIEYMNNESIIIGGDWNVILDMNLDSFRYRGRNRPRAREKIFELMEVSKLKDVWRELNPNDRKFTWRRFNSIQQGRLDYFLISENVLQNTESALIEPGYRSDHSIITIIINTNKNGPKPRTHWKFNNSLLRDIKYIDTIKTMISDIKKQYCALVYNRENIDIIDCKTLELVINDALFLDTLLMEIRGKTIAYSSFKKKESEKAETNLITEIQDLEDKLNEDRNVDILQTKKDELQSIRKNKIDGMIIRSKTQWSLEGERNSKYFCNLEKRHYTDKALLTLEKNDGTITNDPIKIKNEVKTFYETLYKSKEHLIRNVDLSASLTGPSLNDTDRNHTEGLISIEEAGKALKKMKNGKSPGLDGFTTEFFKFFWKDLGAFLVRSINYAFEKGEMSVTQRRGVITCIPKENKPKRFMKNWRPITLLNTTYKIATSCIAERIKGILPKIIGEEQTGFLAGRYIGENIRTLYDVLAYTESHDLPGILMLIDFEKAFDSLAWSFIMKTLDFFKFGPELKRWINIFYTDISACVAVNGSYTGWFQIQRGVRQGDPLSPYLYLISAEILSLLIKKNKDIKGIKLADDVEALLSQFADDTSLFLDGTEKCFKACVYCLEEFTELSGLKMNFEKTQIVWIGSTKNSETKFMRDKNFIWNPGIFKVLGITLSTNIKEIVPLNYSNKLKEIESLLKLWSRRHLTPFGKITVIKSMALAKIVHLFINLPDPSKNFLTQLHKLFNTFLWDSKRAKLNKDISCADYHEGGLKMVDVYSFLAAMKINWLKRLKESTNSSLMNKLTALINPQLIYLSTIGGEVSYNLMNYLCDSNFFWFDVVKHYRRAYSICTPETPQEFLSECIHFNSYIQKSNKYINLQCWIHNGVTRIFDVFDANGNYYSFEDFITKYPRLRTNRREYGQVIQAIRNYQNKCNIVLNQNEIRNDLTKFWHIVLKGGSKSIYGLLKKSPNKWVSFTKWENHYNEQIQWKQIFTKISKTTTDPQLKWFQIRVIHRLIPTNRFLHLRKIKDSPLCTFGCNVEETLSHLFYTCPKVELFWSQILIWIKANCTNCDFLSFSEQLIVFGHKENVLTDNVIDLLILIGKWHIYKCKLQEREPVLDIFKQQFKTRYLIEKGISKALCKLDSFTRSWIPYVNLFT